MSNENFHAMRISFHPDPKIEHKAKFSTQDGAQKHIDTTGNSGEYWMIIKEANNTCDFVKGFRYQK